MRARTRWLIQGVGGLVLIGAGASISIESGLRKMQSEPWFWLGTLGLIILCSGVSLAADSVRFRIQHQDSERRG